MNIDLSRFKTAFAIIPIILLAAVFIFRILRRVNHHAQTMKDFMEEK